MLLLAVNQEWVR